MRPNKIKTNIHRLINKTSKFYKISKNDLYQITEIAIIKAERDYKKTSNLKLNEYIDYRIKTEIKNYLNSSDVQLTSRWKTQQLRKIKKIYNKLDNKTHKQKINFISKKVNLSTKTIENYLNFSYNNLYLENEQYSMEQKCINNISYLELSKKIEVIIGKRDSDILINKIINEKNNKEIGKMFNLSEERIRKIIISSKNKLRSCNEIINFNNEGN